MSYASSGAAEPFRRRFWISLILTLPILFLPPLYQTLVATPVVLWAGFSLFVKGLRTRQINMFTLISIGVGAAYFYSLWAFFYGKELYFEVAAVIVTFVLLGHKKGLEEHVARQQKQIHSYSDTIVLYDLTNTYFEGQAKQNPKAQFGVSKEKRRDCPLVTVGLVLNQHGFLSRSEFLPGNVSEPKSLKGAIEALSSAGDLFQPTMVMDAGFATEENLEWLREDGYTYIVSARQKAPAMEIAGEPFMVGNSEKYQVKVFELPANGQQKCLHCESPAKEATASSMKTFFQKRIEGDLEKLRTALQKPTGRKKLHKVLESIGRIREKHRSISGCYEINAIPSDDGLIAIRIEWKVLSEKIEDKLTGSYYLRTNLL